MSLATIMSLDQLAASVFPASLNFLWLVLSFDGCPNWGRVMTEIGLR